MRRLLLAAAVALNSGIATAAPLEIEDVVLQQGYGTGVSNSITVVYRARVLFSDGSYTSDAAHALLDQPQIDGTWERDGSGWTLTARDGKIKRISTKMRASPAKADATLDGEYRNLSGVGNGAINAVAVAAWKQLRFAPDGSVRQTQGAGAQGSSVATGGAKAHAARYRLDGYTIELQHADGRREYHLFYFFPDGHHAIGLGTATLSQRR